MAVARQAIPSGPREPRPTGPRHQPPDPRDPRATPALLSRLHPARWMPETLRGFHGIDQAVPHQTESMHPSSIDSIKATARILHQINRARTPEAYLYWIKATDYGAVYRDMQRAGEDLRARTLADLYRQYSDDPSRQYYPDHRKALVELEDPDPLVPVFSLWHFLLEASRIVGLQVAMASASEASWLDKEARRNEPQRVQPVLAYLYTPPGPSATTTQLLLRPVDGDDLIPYVAFQWAVLLGYYVQLGHLHQGPYHAGDPKWLPEPRTDRFLTPVLHAFARELIRIDVTDSGPRCGTGHATLGCTCLQIEEMLSARPVNHPQVTGVLEHPSRVSGAPIPGAPAVGREPVVRTVPRTVREGFEAARERGMTPPGWREGMLDARDLVDPDLRDTELHQAGQRTSRPLADELYPGHDRQPSGTLRPSFPPFPEPDREVGPPLAGIADEVDPDEWGDDPHATRQQRTPRR